MWGLEGRRIGEDDPPGRTTPPLPWSSQASVAVKMVFALAAWGPEFTAQHVKRDMDGVRTPAATLSRPRNFRHIEPILPTTQVRMVSAHWAQILFAIDLDCFINTLTQQLSKCSNAMFVAMGKLVSVVARVAVEERRQMIKMVSLIYLDSPAADGGRQSRVAEIACPNGPWLTNRSRTCPPSLAVCRPNERCTPS